MTSNGSQNGNGWIGKVPPWLVVLMAMGGAGTGVGNWAWTQNQQTSLEQLVERQAALTDLLRRVEVHLAANDARIDKLHDEKVDAETSYERVHQVEERLDRMQQEIASLRERVFNGRGDPR